MAAQQVQSAITALDSIFNVSASTASASQARGKRTRKDADVSTSALMALLPSSRKRQRLVKLASSGHPVIEDSANHRSAHAAGYAPSSLDALLDRISTYTLTLWSDQQPEGCSAVHFARYGWRCRRSTVKSRVQLHCEVCETTWDVEQVKQWRTEEGQAAAAGLSRDMKEKHAKSCPWRSRPTPYNIYRLDTTQPPTQLLRVLLEKASALPRNALLLIDHPFSHQDIASIDALLVAQRTRQLLAAQTEMPSSASLVVTLLGWEKQKTPASTSSQPSSPSSASSASTARQPPSSDTTILCCRMCARRVLARHVPCEEGEGAPTGIMPVNLRTSHRKFCPYLAAVGDGDSQEEGWKVLLKRLLESTRTSEDRAADETGSPKQRLETTDAVKMVKDLLAVSKTVRRKPLL